MEVMSVILFGHSDPKKLGAPPSCLPYGIPSLAFPDSLAARTGLCEPHSIKQKLRPEWRALEPSVGEMVAGIPVAQRTSWRKCGWRMLRGMGERALWRKLCFAV